MEQTEDISVVRKVMDLLIDGNTDDVDITLARLRKGVEQSGLKWADSTFVFSMSPNGAVMMSVLNGPLCGLTVLADGRDGNEPTH